MPARTDPVIETMLGVRCPTISAPVAPLPRTTFSTPSGRMPLEISARTSVDSGVVSDGLRTTVLPAAIAGPIFHSAIISG